MHVAVDYSKNKDILETKGGFFLIVSLASRHWFRRSAGSQTSLRFNGHWLQWSVLSIQFSMVNGHWKRKLQQRRKIFRLYKWIVTLIVSFVNYNDSIYMIGHYYNSSNSANREWEGISDQYRQAILPISDNCTFFLISTFPK